MSLTPKQRDLMLYLQRYIDANQISPSYEEMQGSQGLASKSGIHRLLTALIERGYIQHLHGRARAITILRRVHDPSKPTGEQAAVAYRETLELIAAGAGAIGPEEPIDYVRGMAKKVLERFP